MHDRAHSTARGAAILNVGLLDDAAFQGLARLGVFTRADAVPASVEAALRAGARYVVGTTGWDAQLAAVRAGRGAGRRAGPRR